MSADGKLGWRDDHGPIRGQMLLVRRTILGKGNGERAASLIRMEDVECKKEKRRGREGRDRKGRNRRSGSRKEAGGTIMEIKGSSCDC